MGAVGVAALLANAASFGLLWAYRHGDSNMRSVWICSRNDVIGNLCCLARSAWRLRHRNRLANIIVATVMAALAHCKALGSSSGNRLLNCRSGR